MLYAGFASCEFLKVLQFAVQHFLLEGKLKMQSLFGLTYWHGYFVSCVVFFRVFIIYFYKKHGLMHAVFKSWAFSFGMKNTGLNFCKFPVLPNGEGFSEFP